MHVWFLRNWRTKEFLLVTGKQLAIMEERWRLPVEWNPKKGTLFSTDQEAHQVIIFLLHSIRRAQIDHSLPLNLVDEWYYLLNSIEIVPAHVVGDEQ